MSCDIVFVCQAGELEKQAVLLAKSIRLFGGSIGGSNLHAIIPIPEEVYGSINQRTLSFLDSLDVQLYFFKNPVNDSYWYANKLNAFNVEHRTNTVVFLDTDTLVFGDFSEIINTRKKDILVRPAMSVWPPGKSKKHGESVWKDIYAEFNLQFPERRVMSNNRKVEMLPYFSTGVIFCASYLDFSKLWIQVCILPFLLLSL